MKGLILLAGAGIAAYMLYQNSKVDPQYSNIEGWERTAANRRPDMPAPSVDPTPLHPTFWPKANASS